MKRNSYSPEFKAKVALEAMRGLLTANEIASKFEVHPVQVSQWKKELAENMGSIFERKNVKKKPPNKGEGLKFVVFRPAWLTSCPAKRQYG
jgi:transposase-like protein